MMREQARDLIDDLLVQAGISIDGPEPWDIQVHNDQLYDRILAGGSVAVGESYMDGWWDAKELDRFFEKVFSAGLEHKIRRNGKLLLYALKNNLVNPQSRNRSFEVGQRHYDIGNELFEKMLDKHLTYSSGYWKNTKDLDQAQEAKLDLICRKLCLKPGMRLLDIGCGWGSLVKYAAKHYKVEAVGITISKEQAEYARNACKNLPVRIEFGDYRDLNESFDRIASVGMVEHVGRKNYPLFMQVAHDCLNPGGLFLLHTIGSNASTFATDPWIEKYIFPNSMIPSACQITRAAEYKFILEDVHNFGPYYDKTLMAWDENFRKSFSELPEQYDDRFYRMWRFYLMSSAASFRTRRLQLYQFLLGKQPRPTVVCRMD